MKNKILISVSIISMIINIVLVYVIFDNSITQHYKDMEYSWAVQDKVDSLIFLNIMLERSSFNFEDIKDQFLDEKRAINTVTLSKTEENGVIVLDQLCFKKKNNTYKVLACQDLDTNLDYLESKGIKEAVILKAIKKDF
jgi:hypothetical protein